VSSPFGVSPNDTRLAASLGPELDVALPPRYERPVYRIGADIASRRCPYCAVWPVVDRTVRYEHGAGCWWPHLHADQYPTLIGNGADP
jgi:hypothetical protein